MEGFSDRDSDVAVGYYYGLRWWHVQAAAVHALTSVSQEKSGWVTAGCSCGAQCTGGWPGVYEWSKGHAGRMSSPALAGCQDTWQPGLNTAHCLAFGEDHHVPTRGCGCGFWAYWQLGRPQVLGPSLPGLIRGTGRMIEGPLGFRCQTAEIIALARDSSRWPWRTAVRDGQLDELVPAIETAYQVPVYSSVAAMLEMHPAPPGQPPLGNENGDRFAEGGIVRPPPSVPRLAGRAAASQLHTRRESWARSVRAFRLAVGPITVNTGK